MADDIVARLRFEADAHADGDWNDQVIRRRFTEAADEIERLQRWKVEACSVLADWDALYVGLDDRGQLGQRKSAVVAAEIERLQAIVATVDDLHSPRLAHDTCVACDHNWPCLTHLLIHPEESRHD